MDDPKKPDDQIVCGLPRIVAVIGYFVVVSLTGMAVQAADPLQEMMKRSGAYSHLQSELERTSHIASVVSFGLSFSVLSGIIVGPTVDLIGAKLTGLLGLLLHSLGYVFMFMTSSPFLYYVSGVCFGAGFQFILNCHLSAACLFPNNSNLILTFMAAGADVSLFFPYGILGLSDKYGGDPAAVRKAVIHYLIVCVGGAAVIDAVLLPMKPFSTREKGPEQKSLLSSEAQPGELGAQVESQSQQVVPSYWRLSLMQQLGTPDYWLFVTMLIFAFCRKKHFSVLIRPIIAEIDPDPSKTTANRYVDNYNFIVPAGFIPAILWGGLADRFGINTCLFASNALGTIFVVLSLLPFLQLQVLTIAIYIVYQAFIMGQALAFNGSVYGMATVTSLQGLCCSIIGVFSVMMDVVWVDFITNTLGSYRLAGFIWLAISLLMFIFPVVLTIRANRRNAMEGLTETFEETDSPFGNVLPSAQIFDKASLSLIHMRRSHSLGHA